MTHLIWYDAFRTKKSYKRKVCFIMYIRKSLLGGLVAAAGMAVLAILMVLFCFSEMRIPSAVYAAAWFGCLCAMLHGASRIYRHNR